MEAQSTLKECLKNGSCLNSMGRGERESRRGLPPGTATIGGMAASPLPVPSPVELLDLVRRYWGFDQLRPFQEEAIRAGIEGRDALVVLPTGGGKSLCYQVPPLVRETTDIVVSPLISLMKDQVDALEACGYPAVALHSGMTSQQRRKAWELLASGRCRLAFVAPERLVSSEFLHRVERLGIRHFAVDEAHCISHWGHDFRPEYRKLALLKERFPGASLHAYTATATDRVQEDILEQLRLQAPLRIVGRFDRPNLVYRVVPRRDLRSQLLEVLARHAGEAVIVYAPAREETRRLADFLKGRGLRAGFYHAGMGASERRQVQDQFAREQIDVIVATVAFGMGIDRSDVRCVVHSALPKSLEHYQQEAGRAGRDGLEAECILFFSPADGVRWASILEQGAAAAGSPPEVLQGALTRLLEMRRYCAPGRCRHRVLSEYFGQPYPGSNCQACDTCLAETQELEDGTREAQMILSCVARVGQRFGVGHVVDVLRGAQTEAIRKQGHHGLSTYGLLKTKSRSTLIHLVYQLLDQDLLVRTTSDYPVLKLNAASREVLRGERTVRILPVRTRKVRKTRHERDSWRGVDRILFDRLRALRLELARRRGVPPYVVFSDASLRDMARRRPRDPQEFLAVHGVGEKKLADFGVAFLEEIRHHHSKPPSR